MLNLKSAAIRKFSGKWSSALVYFDMDCSMFHVSGEVFGFDWNMRTFTEYMGSTSFSD